VDGIEYEGSDLQSDCPKYSESSHEKEELYEEGGGL
jgi:hypothetical protein